MAARNNKPHGDPNAVTILEGRSGRLGKSYMLNSEGELQVDSFGSRERRFQCEVFRVKNIVELGAVIDRFSTTQKHMVIRGQPKETTRFFVERNNDTYQEPDKGLGWIMMDFDGIPLPKGMCAWSKEAVEYVVGKLPSCFQGVSYYYQHSSSAAVFRPDGEAKKSGFNGHIFFWLDRPATSAQIKAYLIEHCVDEGFYAQYIDNGGNPNIRWGVDPALFNAVQPHYISKPNIELGVTCLLDERQRQGLVRKASDAVHLPAFDSNLIGRSTAKRRAVLADYKKECGWKSKSEITRAANGAVGIHEVYFNPNPNANATGRMFIRAELKRVTKNNRVVTYATLFFQGEHTAGSYFICSANPCIAFKHGEYEPILLKELSPSAYAFVRDDLGWFRDQKTHLLPLTEQGYLPALSSFATAKHCLILAPTGSGKTHAFCEYAKSRGDAITLYAAQTISLTHQMKADLVKAGVHVTHYDDFDKFDCHPRGVYVTTNKSLRKFIETMRALGRDYVLVIDEAHLAIDDFMRDESSNKLLEQAISRARKVIFMTATLTPLQKKKLIETVGTAGGEFTDENFGYYEFAAVKSNPLWWAKLHQLGPDLVALFRHYQSLKERGEQIPRTVIMAPVAKLRRFIFLLEQFGLTEDAHVVSRLESTQEEIEAARVSTKPILISSPVFAIGLNFECVPVRLWAYFDDIEVDTCAVIQTLNRANRTSAACEVRLYAGKLDELPYRIPDEVLERERVENAFLAESSLPGVLDGHFQIDRVTFNVLRALERHTAKTLFQLRRDDAIQNYRIVDAWTAPETSAEGDDKIFGEVKQAAKLSYKRDKLAHLPRYKNEPVALLTYRLIELGRERNNYRRPNPRLPKLISDEECAVSMAILQTTDVSTASNAKPKRLLKLFAERDPYASAQHRWEKNPEWMLVAAKKTAQLARLLPALADLKAGKLNGVSFGRKMRSTLRGAVLALADNDDNFYHWDQTLSRLGDLVEEYKHRASDARRAQIDAAIFDIADSFLNTIGIRFEVEGGQRNPTKPIVPDWNFGEMEKTLLLRAESLKHLPREPIDHDFVDEYWNGDDVLRAVCDTCVHCQPNYFCALGRPIEMQGRDAQMTDKCDVFKKRPKRLLKGD